MGLRPGQVWSQETNVEQNETAPPQNVPVSTENEEQNAVPTTQRQPSPSELRLLATLLVQLTLARSTTSEAVAPTVADEVIPTQAPPLTISAINEEEATEAPALGVSLATLGLAGMGLVAVRAGRKRDGEDEEAVPRGLRG